MSKIFNLEFVKKTLFYIYKKKYFIYICKKKIIYLNKIVKKKYYTIQKLLILIKIIVYNNINKNNKEIR